MPMIPTFEMLSCRRQTIGPQCTAHDFVMTSSATEIVRALEQSWTQIDQLRAELAEAKKPDCRLCEHFDDWDIDCVLRGTAAACVAGHNYLGSTPVRLYEREK